MTNQTDSPIVSTFRQMGLDISKTVIAVLGFSYGVGYLIQAITLRNYGIQRFETLKLQYIEVGLTFSVLFLLVTVMPVACFLAHYRIRSKSDLPHYHAGAAGFLVNTYNLLFLVVFSGIFVTNREWNVGVLGSEIPLSAVLLLYIAVAMFVLVLMPLVERTVVKRKRCVRAIYWLFIEPLRFGAAVFGLFLDVLYAITFPWVRNLGLHGLVFIASAIGLAALVRVILFYINKLGDKHSSPVVAAVSATGIFILLYICVNAYVFAVVRHIPMNRGGKMPITRSYLV